MNYALRATHGVTRWHSIQQGCRESETLILAPARPGETISNKVPRVCGVVRPPRRHHSNDVGRQINDDKKTKKLDRDTSTITMHSDYPRPLHSTAKERSKQITCKLSTVYHIQFKWVSSWPVSLETSRNIATTSLSQMIATRDLWMLSGTGVSRKPSESVFFGLVLRRAGGASASHGPPKVCDDLRGSCAAVEGVRKTLWKKPV